jgi:AcrR family transcriptional regulator
MPLKSSFTKDAFVNAAFKIVQTKGWNNLSARSLAKELNCSTMPIYSYLKSMKSLYEELRKKAIDLLTTYQTTPRTGNIFFDMGVGYILFAKQEKNLFRFLHDPKGEEGYQKIEKRIREFAFKNLIQNMKEDPMLEGLDQQKLKNLLTKMWIFVHGLAFLVNNNAIGNDDENYVMDTIKETGKLLIQGEKSSKDA